MWKGEFADKKSANNEGRLLAQLQKFIAIQLFGNNVKFDKYWS